MSGMDPMVLAYIKAAAAKAGAPILADALDGAGAAAALMAIGHTLLGDDNAKPEDIQAKLAQAVPDDAKLFPEAEQRYLGGQQQSDPALVGVFETFPVARVMTTEDLDNTKDARALQVQSHDKTNERLAYAVSAALLLVIVAITCGPTLASYLGVTTTNPFSQLVYILVGVVATGWANIIGFYFGSSAGSMQKSQTISSALSQSIKQGT